MLKKEIAQFLWGLTDTLRAKDIPRGTFSKCLNWISFGNKIELRRGYMLLGNEITATGGKITGLYRAKMASGTEQLFRCEGKKLKHYNITTENWDEVGTDILGSGADGEKISFTEFKSLAGDQLFVSSPYGPLLKIMLANPTDYADQYDATKNYKGYIKIKQNRMFLWGRRADKTALYISKIDTQTYTTVSSENIGTGDGATITFADTLAFKTAGDKRTCFAISVTDGVETFTDNGDGTLTGDQGGTGTINYMTGAISVTFNTAPAGAQAITCDYEWEDSTVGGIADFDFTTPTRVAGEGDIIRQDDGGILQNVFSFGNDEYCIHEHKAWVLTLTNDDTNATNYVYREKVGIPSRQAGVATGKGIYIINRGDDKDYEMQLLAYNYQNDKVEPRSISKQHIYKKKRVGIDLSGYEFDRAVMWEWGDYILTVCRTTASSVNNRMLVYDKKQKAFAVFDYYADEIAEYNGTLIVGDTLLDNVYVCFSGVDDDDSEITNYVELNEDNLDFEGLKKVKKLVITGNIGVNQSITVSANVDNSGFVEIGTISGSGDYVDKTTPPVVGQNTVGSRLIGEQTTTILSYRFIRELSVGLDKFNSIILRFEATALGWAEIQHILYKDVRIKSHRLPSQYIT